jgi:hypothetical protein
MVEWWVRGAASTLLACAKAKQSEKSARDSQADVNVACGRMGFVSQAALARIEAQILNHDFVLLMDALPGLLGHAFFVYEVLPLVTGELVGDVVSRDDVMAIGVAVALSLLCDAFRGDHALGCDALIGKALLRDPCSEAQPEKQSGQQQKRSARDGLALGRWFGSSR